MLQPDAVRTRNHEAAHCAATLWFGIAVERVDLDPPVVHVTVDRERYFEHLCVMLAGALGEGSRLRWPPQRNAEDGDESSAALLIAALGLDERGWTDAESLTADVLALPEVVRVSRLLAYELRVHDHLDAGRIVELLHEARHDDETCALGAALR